MEPSAGRLPNDRPPESAQGTNEPRRWSRVVQQSGARGHRGSGRSDAGSECRRGRRRAPSL